MNQVKNRLAALALLDRAMAALPDERLATLVDGFDEEFRHAYDHVIGWREDDERSTVDATREACHAGRINGTLERTAALLSDSCLADCIEQLGQHADNPSQEQLLAVTPGLTERHGIELVRLMLASAVAGEAAAAGVCAQLLKKDETLALPPAPPPAPRPVVSKAEDAERAAIRDRRKAERARKQAEQQQRREQAERARRG